MKRYSNYVGVFDELDGEHITVHQDRCTIVRNRRATCMKCADACTSGCISLVDRKLAVDPLKCTGCGTCATVCPTCALEAHAPDDRELFERCVEPLTTGATTVVISCERAGSRGDGARVACLGRVDESLLVLLARAGAQTITLVHGACDGCRHNPGSRVAVEVCASARSLLATWGSTTSIHIEEQSKEIDAAYGGLGNGGCGGMAADDSPDPVDEGGAGKQPEQIKRIHMVQADGTLPHHLPHRRMRLLKALDHFGDPDQTTVSNRLWGKVVIDRTKCTSCQACAIFCPTEAIKKFKEEDGAFGIYHYPYRCAKCHSCSDICPAGALSILDEVAAEDLKNRTCERFEMTPRSVQPGPAQMRDHLAELLGIDFLYER